MNFFIFLIVCELLIDFIVSTNADIFLFDFFTSSSVDNGHQSILAANTSLVNSTDQLDTNNSRSNFNYKTNYDLNSYQINSKYHPTYNLNSYSVTSNGPGNSFIANLTTNQNLNEIYPIQTNFKLKKQKLFFAKKLLLWKRNSQRGYGAFLMLCDKLLPFSKLEPDITCVTPQTKLAIANCMNSGGSALANQLYNSCSNQNRIQCTDQDVARRLLGCLRLQSANNVLITPQSRACVRQVVTLGTLDCFVKILRQKPKYRLGTRYSTISTDASTVTPAGIGEGNGDGVEDPDSESNGRRRMSKREIGENFADENDTILEMANDAAQLVTLNYYDDEQYGGLITTAFNVEQYGDLNRTSSHNDSYSDQYYSESNENYENYDSFSGIMMDFKGNLTSNETSGDDDEFEDVIDSDDNSIPINSAEISASDSIFEQRNGQTNGQMNESVHRSKRQCRNNRRYHNRRYRPKDRSDRVNRRTYYNNVKEESQDLKDEDEDEEKKWEIVGKRKG